MRRIGLNRRCFFEEDRVLEGCLWWQAWVLDLSWISFFMNLLLKFKIMDLNGKT